jgi:hypothetical protein
MFPPEVDIAGHDGPRARCAGGVLADYHEAGHRADAKNRQRDCCPEPDSPFLGSERHKPNSALHVMRAQLSR